MDNSAYVYILASRRNGTLYVGITTDLLKRISEHRSGLIGGFTKRYDVKNLVYFEGHTEIDAAIKREKRLKRWRRKWKLELIENENPEWRDLWWDIIGDSLGPGSLRARDDNEEIDFSARGGRREHKP